ncbi:hypothetical protein ZWY2020_036219 [Hordeum vulgare]|nr:hypothetical protein ZWY2020_036219 [Hordeum vulgare]
MPTATAGGGRGKLKGSKSVSWSVKAGLQFPVGRVAQHLKVGRRSMAQSTRLSAPPRVPRCREAGNATTIRRLVLVGSCIEGVSGLNGMLAIWFMFSASDFSMAT